MILVAGLGKTGLSVLQYLQLNEEQALAYDTRKDFDFSQLTDSFPKVRFAAGELPKSWLTQVHTVVLSPGISIREPWVQELQAAGAQIIGDIELFARAVGVPVIAVTGSNGKSTVVTLVAKVLERAGYSVGLGGNIGTPALALLSDDREYEVFVLELSSFQLETTYSLHTISSALLNVSEDHMDRYDDMNAYLQAKLNIFNDTEVAVCLKDFDCNALQLSKQLKFSLQPPQRDNDYGILMTKKGAYLAKGSTPLVPTNIMALQGAHHQLNAMAMMALCEPFRIAPEDFAYVLKNFTGLPHRTEEILTHKGVRWINDSKGTNVGATLTALESIGKQIDGKIVLLAGGVGKDAEFEALAPAVEAFCSQVILFGEDRQQIAKALSGQNVKVSLLETLLQAICEAKDAVRPGDVVLFSPACASFDQFRSYIHRGEMFSQWVKENIGPDSVCKD